MHSRSKLFFPLVILIVCSYWQTAWSQQNDWQLRYGQVTVLQNREASGDRPYFMTIHFQTRLNVRNQTRVSLHSMEPNDWVSKSEYNRGRLRRGDHMLSGESLTIPWWQSEHEWRRILLATNPLGAFTTQIFGAIVVSLDNNNTPPHVVRGLVGQVASRLETLLKEQIETGAIVRGVDLNSPEAFNIIRNRLISFSSGLTSNLNINLFDWTFGSTFNPDRITGVQAFIFPAIAGLSNSSSSFVSNIAGSPVTIGVNFGAPSAFSRAIDFTGSGARYRLSAVFGPQTMPATKALRSLTLKIRTGDDDLRRNSQAFAVVRIRERGTDRIKAHETNLNGGANWPNRLDKTVSVNLPAGTQLGDLVSMDIRYQSGSTGPFDTTDNWKIDAFSVTAVAEDGKSLSLYSLTRDFLSNSSLEVINVLRSLFLRGNEP